MRLITMPLDEYVAHVKEVKDARAISENTRDQWSKASRALFILLNELHQQYPLLEFCTYANEHQDHVTFTVEKDVVTLRWNDGNIDPEDEGSSESMADIVQRDLEAHGEGD